MVSRLELLVVPRHLKEPFENTIDRNANPRNGKARADFPEGVSNALKGEGGLNVPTGPVEVGSQGSQGAERPGGLKAVSPVIDGVAPLDACAVRFGVGPGRIPDVPGRDPGRRRHPVWGVVPDVLSEPIESHAPGVHEVPVVQPVLDDHVDHAQGQWQVRPRPDPKPGIRSASSVPPATAAFRTPPEPARSGSEARVA